MLALIDGDIITFRSAASAEKDDEWIARARCDEMIDDILQAVGATHYEIWISGANNFRYTVYPEYKANRIGAYRPKWELHIKDHLVQNWQALVSDGCEADDMMGVRQCETEESIICTIDKDLWQIPGLKYNFVKKEMSNVTEAEGLRFFYYQMLVGDPTDNLKGVPGIGPKKATAALAGLESEAELFEKVRDYYNNDEYMEIMGKCLWIWRERNGTWKMPLMDDPSISESQGEETAAIGT